MTDNFEVLLTDSKNKVNRVYNLVQASIKKLEPYKADYDYSYDELEPYDALADRFIRCVEIFIKYFKTYDIYKNATPTLSYRDLINTMEKLSIVESAETWIQMRTIRNKMVHDYLPEQTKIMFDEIMNKFWQQIKFTKLAIDEIKSR
ncbi:MAG: hypothetical protein DRQ51_00315 [Gammaproteobacteria bacterium]|nr:MAG: hypothetical protein DRQ51_00315 [Gammaproteobacteria bacterium]